MYHWAMKQIFILTNFSSYLRSYSPIICVGEQLKQMTRAGYAPVLITATGWEPPEDTVFAQVRNVQINPGHVYGTPSELSDEDNREIEDIYTSLHELLPEESTVITHDLIFLPDYTKHNIAARRLAEERPSIQWIHVIHSATSPNSLINERAMYGEKYKELLSAKFPNSIIAFPNAYSIPRVARNFNYEEDEIFEVPHSTDPTEGMEVVVRRLYDERELGDADILMVYPLRLDRGKNAEWNVRIIAAAKDVGLSAHLIFCDFQSTGDDKVVYREDLKALARELQCEDQITFLSEFDEASSLESSHKVVLDLFTLSNVFVMPSKSETYSLVAQEAMLKGNLCILNHDFSPFRQIYGQNAIYRQFDGANIGFDGHDGEINTNWPDPQDAARRHAMNIKYYLEHDKALKAKTWVRTRRNPDAVFRNALEPLLYRVPNE
jgi:glycosyltransferase involved in cell wall biosynthesis